MLRAGKIQEAQLKLIETNQIELYEYVSGGVPAFDNTSFVESDDFGDFLPTGIENQSYNEAKKRADRFENNVVSGNRANLLFVDSCIQMIRENQVLASSGGQSMHGDYNKILDF